MNRDRIYPIIWTADEVTPEADREGLVTPLGHDLYVGLVEESAGQRAPVRLADLRLLLLDAYGGHVIALDNLERFAKSRGMNATLYRTKSDQPFVAWHGSWLAASSCQLPYLYKLVRRQLAVDRICLSIPHRGAMILFPEGDPASRDEMRSVIRRCESQAPEQLTFDLFSLQADGVSAFYEED